MSVLNVSVEPDRVRIYTDTLAYVGNAPSCLVERKCSIMPGGFAVTTRGSTIAGEHIDKAMSKAGCINEALYLFSDGQLSELLETMFSPNWAKPQLGDGFEVGLFGFDEGPIARRMIIWPDLEITSETFGTGLHLFPCDNLLKAAGVALPERATDAQMVALAMAQQRIAEKHRLPLCVGGLLHRTAFFLDQHFGEVAIEQEIVAAYPGYPELADKFGCPNGEEYLDWFRARGVAA